MIQLKEKETASGGNPAVSTSTPPRTGRTDKPMLQTTSDTIQTPNGSQPPILGPDSMKDVVTYFATTFPEPWHLVDREARLERRVECSVVWCVGHQEDEYEWATTEFENVQHHGHDIWLAPLVIDGEALDMYGTYMSNPTGEIAFIDISVIAEVDKAGLWKVIHALETSAATLRRMYGDEILPEPAEDHR